MLVVDSTDDEVYRYSTTGGDLGSWDLNTSNGNPTGITYAGSEVLVVDSDDRRGVPLQHHRRRPGLVTPRSKTKATPQGIGFGDTQLFIVDNTGDRVFLYRRVISL